MKFLHDSDFKGNILDSGIDLDTKYEPVITKLTGFNKNLGTTAGTLAEGNHGHPGIAPGAHASTHITGGLDIIPIAVAGGNAGLLSGADKTKLNGIATGANLYVHPTTSGNIHIPTGGASGQVLQYSASGVAVWANIITQGTVQPTSGYWFKEI